MAYDLRDASDGRLFCSGVLSGAMYVHAAPTTLRRIGEGLNALDSERRDFFRKSYQMGMGLTLIQLGLYFIAAPDRPRILLVPLITNVLSGIYEFGRTKMEERRKARMPSPQGGLESRLKHDTYAPGTMFIS